MFLRHIYSDNVKVESKYVYELLSVSKIVLYSFSWLIDSVLAVLKRNVSRYLLNILQLIQYVRYLSMQTNSIVSDSRKPVFYL